MRYKYQHILQECNRLYIAVTVMDMGHSLYEWNWTSSEFLIGRSRKLSIFNNDLIISQLRKIIGMLTTTFEQQPLQRLVVVNSMPGKMSMNSLYNFSRSLAKLTEFYMLRYLPGTFSNGYIMYNYWYKKLFNRLKNRYSREWRAFNRSTMIKIAWVPDLILLLGAANESANLAREIDQLIIPSIVLLDTNAAPVGTFYPVRGSDANTRIFRYLLTLFGTCVGFGKELAFYSFEKYFDMNHHLTSLKKKNGRKGVIGQKKRSIIKFLKHLIGVFGVQLKGGYGRQIRLEINRVKMVSEFEEYQKTIHQDQKISIFTNKFRTLVSSIPFFNTRKVSLEKIEAVHNIAKSSFLTSDRRVHFITDPKTITHFTFAILKKLRIQKNNKIKHYYKNKLKNKCSQI